MDLLPFLPASNPSLDVSLTPEKERGKKPHRFGISHLFLLALISSGPLWKWPTAEPVGCPGRFLAPAKTTCLGQACNRVQHKKAWTVTRTPLNATSLQCILMNLLTFPSCEEGAAFRMLIMTLRGSADKHLVKWHHTDYIPFYTSIQHLVILLCQETKIFLNEYSLGTQWEV